MRHIVPVLLFFSLSCSASVLPKSSQFKALELRNPEAAKIATTIIDHYEARCEPLSATQLRDFLSSSEYYHALVGVSGLFGRVTEQVYDLIDDTQSGMECENIDAAMLTLSAKLGLKS